MALRDLIDSLASSAPATFVKGIGRGGTAGLTDYPAAAASYLASKAAGYDPTFGDVLSSVREQKIAEQQANPFASAAGEITGAVVNPIGRFGAATRIPGVSRALAPATSIPGQVAQQAAFGGLAGYNQAGDIEQGLIGAATGGGLGAVLGGTAKAAERARQTIAKTAVTAGKEAQIAVATNKIEKYEAQIDDLIERKIRSEAMRSQGYGKGLPTPKSLDPQIEKLNKQINSQQSTIKAASNDLSDLRAGNLSPQEVNDLAGNLFGGNLTKTALQEVAQNLPNLGWLSGWGGLASPLVRLKAGALTTHIAPETIPGTAAAAGRVTSGVLLPRFQEEIQQQPQRQPMPGVTGQSSLQELNQMFEQGMRGAPSVPQAPVPTARTSEQKQQLPPASDLDALFEAGRNK